jgi:hypothetical protein
MDTETAPMGDIATPDMESFTAAELTAIGANIAPGAGRVPACSKQLRHRRRKPSVAVAAVNAR